MVGSPHDAVLFHPLDQPGGAVIADAELPLEPTGRGLLAFHHQLDGVAILLVLGRILAVRRAIERETILGFLGDGLDIIRLTLPAPVIRHRAHLVVADERAVHAHRALAAGHIQHVALAQQLFRALFAQNRARIDLRGDVEADARRQVRLDHAGDDVDRGPLRRHDQVDARRARLLCQPLDEEFDLLARRHHQIGEFVDDHHDLGQHLEVQRLLLIDRLARIGIVTGLDLAAERLALGLGSADLVVEAGEAAYADRRHLAIAILHLLDRPFERPHRLGRIGDDRRQQMRDIVVHAEFQHLRVDHDHAALVRRQAVEQRQDHTVEPDRLARSGGARDEQMRHRGQIGDDRITRDILAQHQRQRGGLILERLRTDQFVQADRLASDVGQLDADHGPARNRRDARGNGAHIAGDIVGQLDHAARLDPAGGFQFVHRDDRPGAHFDD